MSGPTVQYNGRFVLVWTECLYLNASVGELLNLLNCELSTPSGKNTGGGAHRALRPAPDAAPED